MKLIAIKEEVILPKITSSFMAIQTDFSSQFYLVRTVGNINNIKDNICIIYFYEPLRISL